MPARALAAHLAPTRETTTRTLLLIGEDQPGLAVLAHLALEAGHRVVLPPRGTGHRLRDLCLPSGSGINVSTGGTCQAMPVYGTEVRTGWDLSLFSSGSTTGHPRAYGLTLGRLDTVTAWYETIYQVTQDSVIVTALPVSYNFPFIAGVLLAARLGARLHLSRTFSEVLTDAAHLANTADRVIVLANPVVLDQATGHDPLPARIMIDSGGAPLSTTAITHYRDHGIDVREGYGLTETASLTHFDTQAGAASLGTVGTAMPGVTATITREQGRPLINLATPALAVPLDLAEPLPGPVLGTTDLGQIDHDGRLRILGRADDHPIGGRWPRDTLDALGPLLRHRCALVRHPSPGQATIRLLTPTSPPSARELVHHAAEYLGLPREHITITIQDRPLLHSAKLPTGRPRGAGQAPSRRAESSS
ncbi:AMP-binding protein [Spongiactinospora rosea]|nr:AMP-binding protein [Spongiactinospora rosea]